MRGFGRLGPGVVIEADPDSLSDAERAASLVKLPLAQWLAEAPPEDAPGLWKLSTLREFYQARLRCGSPRAQL